ncbi:MAG: DUF935 family protein [Burkholderiales bacterium]|nr:DUF935 family protein [Burkholderiales bacterium]
MPSWAFPAAGRLAQARIDPDMAQESPILDASGRPFTQEIATIARDLTRIAFGPILENLDDTLRTRGRAKGLKIYDELKRDPHIYSVLQKRALAVTARPWQVDPASDRRDDKKAAELVKQQLQALGFDRLTTGLLDAVLKGFSVGEVLWAVDGAQVVAHRVRVRNQRRFAFTDREELRLLTRERPIEGEVLPERKFIVHRFGDEDDNPYGLGLGHKLFWCEWFKRQNMSFWLIFNDKFGSPTATGKYPVGTKPADQQELLAALRAISQDAGIIFPEGMVVELLEATRSGTVDTYERFVRYQDEQISECVLGETLTTNIGSSGSRAAAETHNDVREELAKADADLLSDTLNSTLVRWIVDFNLPGAGYPTVYRVFEEPEDIDKRSQVDERLHRMGYEPESIEQINETYGGKWRKKAAAPAPKPGEPQPPDPDAQFAEGGGDVADAYTEQLHGAAAAAMDGLIAPVQRLVMEATSLEELRDRLLDLYAELDVDALATVMQRALAAAELAGRYEASRGE